MNLNHWQFCDKTDIIHQSIRITVIHLSAIHYMKLVQKFDIETPTISTGFLFKFCMTTTRNNGKSGEKNVLEKKYSFSFF